MKTVDGTYDLYVCVCVLLILDITRNARAAILRKFSNLHICVVYRYVAGVITVNSLIYDIPCIISRDFMRRGF